MILTRLRNIVVETYMNFLLTCKMFAILSNLLELNEIVQSHQVPNRDIC